MCNAFTPLRSSTGGAAFVEDLAERHGLVPRLGFFSGAEGRIPVDFDAVQAAVADGSSVGPGERNDAGPGR